MKQFINYWGPDDDDEEVNDEEDEESYDLYERGDQD